MIINTIKYQNVINKILNNVGISSSELQISTGIMLVMLYEILFGNGKISGGGAVKRAIMSNIITIKNELNNEMIKANANHHSDLLAKEMIQATTMMKYIRLLILSSSLSSSSSSSSSLSLSTLSSSSS